MLRPYQEEDVQRILQQKKIGIFNEQRTGKTPTVLKAIEQQGGRTIFVCPASMVIKIASEARKFTSIEPTVYTASMKPKARAQALEDYQLLIVSHELYRMQLSELIPDNLVVDEAHRLSRTSKLYTAMRRTNRKACHPKMGLKIFMTGTPASNHPTQVFPLLNLIDPATFSSYWAWAETYFNIEETRLPAYLVARTGVSFTQTPKDFKPGMALAFAQLLDRYAINRKRIDVMPWLPQREEPERIALPCTSQQEKEAKQLMSYFKVGDMRVQGILDQLMRLRQLYNAPELVGVPGVSPKIKWIKDYLSDYPDKKVIIFSRFTKFLELIRNEVKGQCELFVGSTPQAKRQDLINRFQKGTLNVLLIQVDAGKEGITLDAADTLILSDVYPPVSDIEQAKDRIVPTTQSTLKPFEIIELCMAGTYDEELYNLCSEKKALADIANNFKEYILKEV